MGLFGEGPLAHTDDDLIKRLAGGFDALTSAGDPLNQAQLLQETMDRMVESGASPDDIMGAITAFFSPENAEELALYLANHPGTVSDATMEELRHGTRSG